MRTPQKAQGSPTAKGLVPARSRGRDLREDSDSDDDATPSLGGADNSVVSGGSIRARTANLVADATAYVSSPRKTGGQHVQVTHKNCLRFLRIMQLQRQMRKI